VSKEWVIWSFLEKSDKVCTFNGLVLNGSHGSGVGGCEILKQWHGQDANFFRGKSRISITFRGTQGILSKYIV
jgi:hypothetical protein